MKKLLSIALLMTMVAASPVLCMEPDENNNNEDKKKISFFQKTKQKAKDKKKQLVNSMFLHATKKGNINTAKGILRFGGADVNTQDKNMATPLHFAARSGDLKAVQLLIENKADVNMQVSGGLTSLHVALSFGQNEIAQFLVENGADIQGEDVDKNTPFGYAIFQKNSDMMMYILDSCCTKSFDASNAWQKVKPLLVGLHDKNSLLSMLPKDVLLNILFYAPDCITSQNMFEKVLINHCGTLNNDALNECMREYGSKDELGKLQKLLEHQNEDGDNAFTLFDKYCAKWVFQGEDLKSLFLKLLDPENIEKVYTLLLIKRLCPQKIEQVNRLLNLCPEKVAPVETITDKDGKKESKE